MLLLSSVGTSAFPIPQKCCFGKVLPEVLFASLCLMTSLFVNCRSVHISGNYGDKADTSQ